MAQQFDYPKTESDLRRIQDDMYKISHAAKQQGTVAGFKGLLEIISSETTILTAIHNIKSNRGSKTAGTDNETMQEHILNKDFSHVIERVQKSFTCYRPLKVRRVLIPKPGKTELRPLGIPAIIDRIIQECVRIVIEPILEAQFYEHSYGFRPMRDAEMAIGRIGKQIHSTGYHWVIEGDISKFFDTINHSILLRKLWSMGIRDRRVLMVIKQMLKAGIMNELEVNHMGTPQGGIISPLLANVYLNSFDQMIAGQWHQKKTKTQYASSGGRMRTLRTTKLKPAYLVRYADDWVLITDSKRNAEKWKWKIETFLHIQLRLTLSNDKTLITNTRKDYIHFLGFEVKMVKGNAVKGYVVKSQPNRERLKGKVQAIHKNIRKLRHVSRIEYLIADITIINQQIRGLIEYYQCSTNVNVSLTQRYSHILRYAGYQAIRNWGRKGRMWVPANQTDNLLSVHQRYSTWLPAISHQGITVGITNLGFARFIKPTFKNQDETPFTAQGRTLHALRTGRKPLLARADDLVQPVNLATAVRGTDRLRTFEYQLNRAYVYNRDKGKCRICGNYVYPSRVHVHHIDPALPDDLVNKVSNLTTTDEPCHYLIHWGSLDGLDKKMVNKILKLREKLDNTT